MKTLCYVERDTLDCKTWTIYKTSAGFILSYGCLTVKTAESFAAALDIISGIKSPQNIAETWNGCEGINCQQGCETCYPIGI